MIKEQKGGEQRLVWEGIRSAVLVLLLCPCGPLQGWFTQFYVAVKEEQATVDCYSFLLKTAARNEFWQKTGGRMQTLELESGERNATAYEGVISISSVYCGL